ncbi:MAG: CAAX prenyl protease-related protein [Verrucomicrobiota bacterium]|nr:CAAX prenyl protease-related protein [Verrucomicrobiota bacterium]
MFSSNPRTESKLIAYASPMLLFVGLLGVVSLLKFTGSNSFWLQAPEFWIYPLQTILCGAALIYFWRQYEFHRLAKVFFVIVIAFAVFVLWISPQALLGFAPRTQGFNPDLVAGNAAAYWSTIVLRFFRLVVVVPLVEEIFWRGFLLRYFINENFDTVPFGAFSWLSFSAVTIGFTLSHSTADWAAAALTGALYNFVAYRTRSLSSCILAHGITNLLLGLWVMQSRQWGFW